MLGLSVFLDYFHLREQPFGVTPDPRFLLDTPSHREAWATLKYGIESGRGFLALVAPPGLGKTTLLFRLMEELRGKTRTAFLFETQCDSDEFLSLLLADFEEARVRPDLRVGLDFGNQGVPWQVQCNHLIRMTSAEGAAILIQQGPSLACVASSGTAPPIGSMAPIDSGLSGQCFLTGQTVTSANIHHKISADPEGTLPYRSFLIAPIRSNGLVVGVVELLSSRESALGDREKAALEELYSETGTPRDSLRLQRRRPDRKRSEMHEELHALLAQEAEKGIPPVLIVDEAQNLTETVLETIRLLSDFETTRSKLLQVVLAGQPELETRLASPSLVQLRQRVSMMSALVPLSPVQVHDYIAHRLRVAGHQGPPLFSPSACDTVAALSGGIPRNVNNICFHALSLACALGSRVVDNQVLREVANDLSWGSASQFRDRAEKLHAIEYGVSQEGAQLQPPEAVPYSSLGSAAATDSILDEIAVQPRAHSTQHSPPKSLKRVRKLVVLGVVAASSALLVSFTLMVRSAPARNDVKVLEPKPSQEMTYGNGPHQPEIKSEATDGNRVVATSTRRDPPNRSQRAVKPGVPAYPAPFAGELEPESTLTRNRQTAETKALPAQASETVPLPLFRPLDQPSATTSNPPPRRQLTDGQSGPIAVFEASAADPQPSEPVVRSSVPAKTTFKEGALLKMVRPSYPSEAKQAGIQGEVVLNAIVSEGGSVKKVETISGNPALVGAAIDAVKQWRYEASVLNGHPIDVQKHIIVKFTLASVK